MNENTNEIESLNAKIAALEERVAALEAKGQDQPTNPILAMLAGKMPPKVQESKAIFDSIPDETKQALGVQKVQPDPSMVWFKMFCVDGRQISVKKTETDFRIRVRSEGEQMKQAVVSLNGLNAALAKLVK